MNDFNVHQIIPGILEKDWSEIEKKIGIISGFSKVIHIDFIDGKFASNVTFLDLAPFSKYAKELYLEAHLMVENPLSFLKPLADAGFKRFFGQVEKMSDQEEFVAEGQILGEVGLALDLSTPIENLKVPLEDLDAILLMSVKAGQSGQSFDQSCLERIKALRSKTFIPIEIDGGINHQNIVQIKEAGADRFVSTSFIFEDPQKYFQLQKLLQA